jgi:hypothetical protein
MMRRSVPWGCAVLQHVVLRCSLLRCIATYSTALQHNGPCGNTALHHITLRCNIQYCVAAVQHIARCGDMLHYERTGAHDETACDFGLEKVYRRVRTET